MTTRHLCPACDNYLHSSTEDGTTIVFCRVGHCPSTKANDGIKGSDGETVDELAVKFIAQLEADPDWQD